MNEKHTRNFQLRKSFNLAWHRIPMELITFQRYQMEIAVTLFPSRNYIFINNCKRCCLIVVMIPVNAGSDNRDMRAKSANLITSFHLINLKRFLHINLLLIECRVHLRTTAMRLFVVKWVMTSTLISRCWLCKQKISLN